MPPPTSGEVVGNQLSTGSIPMGDNGTTCQMTLALENGTLTLTFNNVNAPGAFKLADLSITAFQPSQIGIGCQYGGYQVPAQRLDMESSWIVNRSVLELRMGGLPFPHGGRDGEWRYRHAVRPDGVTPLDHQAITDFLAYEARHARHVEVIADPALSGWERWRAPEARPDPGAFPTQCCTHVYPGGCTAELVCHGAPAAAAARILADGMLRPATAVTGRSARDLAAESTWGEPADYFEHVMLANGRCTAPEAVACSRMLGRDLTPSDLRPGYPPAVRFYFGWRALAAHPCARFDGVHPVKILGDLRLDDSLIAVVAHASQRHLFAAIPGRLADRVAFVDIDRPSPQDWAVAALTRAASP